MSKSTQELIIEGLRPNKIDEGNMVFRKYYGVRAAQDILNVKKGTLFYVKDVNAKTVTLECQTNKDIVLTLPLEVAQKSFLDASGLEKGNTYTLDIDFAYDDVENCKDLIGWNEKFIDKYTKGNEVVFNKGTKFKYLGSDKSGDFFKVDGVTVVISNVDDVPEAEGISDLFKESKGN